MSRGDAEREDGINKDIQDEQDRERSDRAIDPEELRL
jgi:hypothetical protein